MREIKFRAWQHHKGNDDTGWMTYYTIGQERIPLFTFVKSSIENSREPGRNFVKEHKESMDYALMQYTGLKDKNGKEIYEGDIVKMLSRSLSQVYFSDGGFCVDVGGELIGLHPDFLGRYRTVEVIGNIYENKELLEEKK